MEWKRLNKFQAKGMAEIWKQDDKKGFEIFCRNLDTAAGGLNSSYRTLRSELIKAWRETEKEINSSSENKRRTSYLTDLVFGIKLYRIMQEKGMDIRMASYDQIWTYLGMAVVPEITMERFGDNDPEKPGFHIPEEHYYIKSVRIYLKSLWWYIYLSLRFDKNGKEDLAETREMLWDQTTDTILQLVERSGREGYRVDVYREIMKFYCDHPEISSAAFRHVMILNTARSKIMEPDFTEGGCEGYVKELFNYFRKEHTA